MSDKRCTRCGIEKPATTEYFYRHSTNGLRAVCKTCWLVEQKHYDKTGGKEAGPRKRCARCRKKYPITTAYYHRNCSHKDGLGSYCKRCMRKYQKKYYAANRPLPKPPDDWP